MKKKLVTVFAVLIMGVLTGCGGSIIRSIPIEKRLVVAVTDFQNNSGLEGVDDIIKQFGGTLIFELQATKCFRIIERSRIDAILKEHSFSMTGLVDPANMKTIGRIIGVDALVVGSFSKAHYTVNETIAGPARKKREQMDILIDARLISVETGEIISSSKAESTSKNSLSELGDLVRDGRNLTKVDLLNEALAGTARKLARDIAKQAADR